MSLVILVDSKLALSPKIQSFLNSEHQWSQPESTEHPEAPSFPQPASTGCAQFVASYQ